MKNWYNKLLVVIAFALAMGMLEAVVVVYLRMIYFPEGFAFPIKVLGTFVMRAELARELSTMVMLAAVGLLSGKAANGKFAWFLLAFGIWDLAYYGGLKLFLDWPASLLTWDILFLIPVTWVGPVLAPVICSITMVALGIILSHAEHKGIQVRIGKRAWVLLVLGALLILTTYVEDYFFVFHQTKTLSIRSLFSLQSMIEVTAVLSPENYNWWLFGAGEILILLGIYRIWRKNNRGHISR